MLYNDEKKEAVVVFTGKTARYLLRLGYKIIDIKPDKKNKIKSVFVFQNEEGLERDMNAFLYDKEKNIFEDKL